MEKQIARQIAHLKSNKDVDELIHGRWSHMEALDGYEILELARTGIAGLGRGIENVTYLE